jgi:hypothetical protein
MEMVWEEVTDDEGDAPAAVAPDASYGKPKIAASASEPNKENKKAAPAASKSKPAAVAGNQKSMMSFFGKK